MAVGSVDVTREGHVSVLTLNRPPVNALSTSLMTQLGQTLRGLATEEKIRAIVLTGAGEKAFCAGGDIDEFAAMDKPALLAAIQSGQRLVWDIEHPDKPTIAAGNRPGPGRG